MPVPVNKNHYNWFIKQNEKELKRYARAIRYQKKLYKAWPEWCAEHEGFITINKEAAERKLKGEKVEIDHIVPICSDYVCGLHVPWNLQVIPAALNKVKSNNYWPDCWFEQLALELA